MILNRFCRIPPPFVVRVLHCFIMKYNLVLANQVMSITLVSITPNSGNLYIGVIYLLNNEQTRQTSGPAFSGFRHLLEASGITTLIVSACCSFFLLLSFFLSSSFFLSFFFFFLSFFLLLLFFPHV
jgi:hypothetical protein